MSCHGPGPRPTARGGTGSIKRPSTVVLLTLTRSRTGDSLSPPRSLRPARRWGPADPGLSVVPAARDGAISLVDRATPASVQSTRGIDVQGAAAMRSAMAVTAERIDHIVGNCLGTMDLSPFRFVFIYAFPRILGIFHLFFNFSSILQENLLDQRISRSANDLCFERRVNCQDARPLLL